MEEIRLGNLYGATGGNYAGNVYDMNGLCPTINTCGGGGREPMIVETKELGFIEKGSGKHQSNIVYAEDGLAPTITASYGYKQPPAMHVEIKQATKVGYLGKEQRQSTAVYSEDGLAPNITTAHGSGNGYVMVKQATKDGYIPCEVGGVVDLNYPDSTTRRGRVQGNGQISPTLTTENIPSVLEPWIWEIDGVTYLIRIRKLTPRECWRLMDFRDEDFDKAQAVNSNTQLYKQAGNSIVRNVLVEALRPLFSEV